ncbi:MAG: tannase/feruloyl esterase family alpha/beta hydrolase [Croceibacterium sp.]
MLNRPTGSGPAQALPQHCLVRGTINRRVGVGGRTFGIGFELRMPLSWNGRFLFQGGAGLDGVVAPATGTTSNSALPPALTRGFAVVSTDAGHSGSPIDASFATDQQARVDYGYNALDKVTLTAKALITGFYSEAPHFSYFVGCSNGGRQALTAAQRLPLYFDGIVAGDPTIRFSRVTLDQVFNLSVLARIAPKDAQGRPIYSRAFSDADLKLVRQGVLARCDATDGLADGMINDWQSCGFDPAVLVCKGTKSATCLTQAQVEVLHDLHRGPRVADGKLAYGAFNYDTGIASSTWRGMRLGTSDTGTANAADATLGLGAFRYLQLTPHDAKFDPLTRLDVDDLVERTRVTAALTDADDPFLATFAARGKMIVYNGLSDQGLASSVLVDWYDRMLKATGAGARESVRLFLVPGMLHCGGGEATDRFEMLDAIMDWVEGGAAPARIVAASSRETGLTRPLCPYPATAHYAGGDVNSAASFTCSIRSRSGAPS